MFNLFWSYYWIADIDWFKYRHGMVNFVSTKTCLSFMVHSLFFSEELLALDGNKAIFIHSLPTCTHSHSYWP